MCVCRATLSDVINDAMRGSERERERESSTACLTGSGLQTHIQPHTPVSAYSRSCRCIAYMQAMRDVVPACHKQVREGEDGIGTHGPNGA